MSGRTYYEYKDVKVNIAHRLFKLDGWRVYGYYADNSDPYTDYYDPAYWSGIATKNGYTLVIDHQSAAEEHRRTYTVNTDYSPEITEKIKKLEKMTTENGASESEEATAKAAILKLQEKQTAGQKTVEEYTPGHQANPPRCNWHIEKDGIIIDKGTGLLKFASVPDISKESELKEWQDFNNLSREEWINKVAKQYAWHWNESEERAKKSAESAYKSASEKYQLLEQFNVLINRFNTIAGGMVGNSGENGFTYEIRKVIKYKTVYKFQPTTTGTFTPGQCFRLKHSFTYGCRPGFVYRFMSAYEGQIVRGQRVSLKSNKTLTGTANQSNSFGYYAAENAEQNHGRDKEQFLKWIETGAIEWGEVVEVQEPYEVEKAVKVDASGNEYKPTKNQEQTTEAAADAAAPADVNYIITPDKDTRDGSALWVVTLSERVSREQFETIRDDIKKRGGYYSRFKKGFIFKTDPTNILKAEAATEESNETTAAPAAAQTTKPATETPAADAANTPAEDQTTETTETPAAETPAADNTPENATEAPKTTQNNNYDGISTEAPAEAKKAVYGYTGNASDLFTAEEVARLDKGEQIRKGEGWTAAAYFSTPYKNGVNFIYSLSTRDNNDIQPKINAGFAGFTYAGNYYNDFAAIIEELASDINTELLKQIPTEAAAEQNAVNLDKHQEEQVTFYKKRDYTKDAQTHYLDNTIPELDVYKGAERISAAEAIRYITNPGEVVADHVKEYRRAYRFWILEKYITYNRTVTALNAIRSNQNDPAHVLKAIKDATSGGNEKTFRVTLRNGNTVKAEAHAIKRLPYCGWISSYYVNCSDRKFLDHDERGRAEDIKPDDITAITHGTRVLYKRTA